MANINEEYSDIKGAIKRLIDLASDPTLTVVKVDMRAGRNSCKFVATVYRDDENDDLFVAPNPQPQLDPAVA